MPIKIGDIEKMLPYGMYLHKKYNSAKFHSVVRLQETNSYVTRKNLVIEQAEKIKDQRRKMQSDLLEKKKDVSSKSKKEKSVPKVVQSAKFTKMELGKTGKK